MRLRIILASLVISTGRLENTRQIQSIPMSNGGGVPVTALLEEHPASNGICSAASI